MKNHQLIYTGKNKGKRLLTGDLIMFLILNSKFVTIQSIS